MFHTNRKVKLPLSFYINNGQVAEKVMTLISVGEGELLEETISNIREVALQHDQEVMGEATFAKTLVGFIDTIKTNPVDKLNLILDMARMAITLRNIEVGKVQTRFF